MISLQSLLGCLPTPGLVQVTMERKKAGKKQTAIAGAPALFFCVFLLLMNDCFTVVLFGLLIFASIRSLGSALVG